MKIWISKRSIIWLIGMILGGILLFRGISADNKYRNFITFEELDVNHCKKGIYVRADIYDLVKADIHDNGVFTGNSADRNGYKEYTVPVKNGAYIRIWVGGNETGEALEALANGERETVSFEGKLVEADFMPNYGWYEKIEGFDVELLASNLVVKQIDKKSINYTIYLGIDIIIIGLLMSLTGFSGETFIVDEGEKERQKRRPIKSYNVDNDIRSEQKKLAMLEQQRCSMQKDFHTNLKFLLGSLFILLIVPVEMKLLCVLPALFATYGCFMCWLHQPNPTASLLAGILGITPICKRIKECEEMIERLERSRINEQPIIMTSQEMIEETE